MPTRRNSYYVDPAIGQAFSNIAGLFAPTAPGDVARIVGAEAAAGENRRQQQAFDTITAPGVDQGVIDQYGIAAGLYDPTRSFFAQNQNDATARRGDDLRLQGTLGSANIAASAARYGADRGYAASTENNLRDNARARELGLYTADRTYDASTQNNLRDNQRNAITSLFGALDQGQVRPSVPDDIMAALGLSGLDAEIGLPKPRSETEVRGGIVEDAYRGGRIPDDMLQAMIFGDTPVTNVQTEAGPRVSTVPNAIGQEPFINPGSQAAPEAIQLVDRNTGERFGGWAVNGQFLMADGRTPASPELVPQRLPQAQGPADQLGTNSNLTDYNRMNAAVTNSNLLISQLRNLVNSQSGAAGLAGTIKSVGQDLVQTARELGGSFGEDAPVSLEALRQLADRNSTGPYNPVYQQIRTGLLELAYLNAQRNNPRGEVSRFALERELGALGQGVFANDQSLLAALDMAEQANTRALRSNEALIGRQPPVTQPPGAQVIQTPAGAVTIRRIE